MEFQRIFLVPSFDIESGLIGFSSDDIRTWDVRQFEGLKLAEKGTSSFEVSKFESRRVSFSPRHFPFAFQLVDTFIKTRSIR